jgi:hypothetical protein
MRQLNNITGALNRLGANSGRLPGIPKYLAEKLLFLWTGKYDGDNLLNALGDDYITVTDRDWTSRWVPEDTEATFSVPDEADYLSADTDGFWFDGSDDIVQKTITDLLFSKTQRTFIKYRDVEPYDIIGIGILKDDVVLTLADKIRLNRYFRLWVEYWGEMMDSGYMKGNRMLGGTYVISATIAAGDPDKIAIRMSDPLDDTSTPAPSAFTISPSRTVTGVVISGDTVTLTVSVPFEYGNVTVSYAKPLTNPLKDLDGEEISDFTRGVMNNTINIVVEGHSFAMASAFTPQIIVDRYGDGQVYAYPTSGSTVAGIAGRAETTDAKLVTNKGNILIIWIGTNDITNSAGTGTSTYNALKSYVEARIAAGWTVFTFTCTPSTYTGKDAGFEAERGVFNELLRSDLATLSKSYVVDTDTEEHLVDSTDTLYFYDLLHPQWLGAYYAVELLFAKMATVLGSNAVPPAEIDVPINLTLAATGTGAAVATMRIKVTADVTATLTGAAHFYTDVNGTTGESSTYTFIPYGGEKCIYLKCTTGTATLVLSKNKVSNFGGVSSSVGWTAGTNAPSIGGDISQFDDAECIVVNGNNTLSGSVTALTQLTILSVFGSNTISGSVTALTQLTILNVTGSNTLTGDVSLLVSLVTFICEGSNTLSGSITGMTNLSTLKVLGSNTLTGSVENKTALIYLWLYGSNTVSGDIGVNNVVTGITTLLLNPTRITYTAGATWSNATIVILPAAGYGFSVATQISMLIDMNNSASGPASKSINLNTINNDTMADTTQGGIWGDFDGETTPSDLAVAYKSLVRTKSNTITLRGITAPGGSGDGTGLPAGFGDWYRS